MDWLLVMLVVVAVSILLRGSGLAETGSVDFDFDLGSGEDGGDCDGGDACD